MKLVSWNVNGIRKFKNNLKELFGVLESSILCLQETKVSRSTLEEDIAFIQGYNSYFSSPRYISGYSGVATYCLDSCIPHTAEEGLSGLLVDDRYKEDCVGEYPEFHGFDTGELISLDSEGRALVTRHHMKFGEEVKSLFIINVYCPRMDPDRPERGKYKLQFYRLLQQKAEALVKNGHHVIIAGDINTSHKLIDNCHSGDIEEFCSAPSRQWMDAFLIDVSDVKRNEGKAFFVDTFRHFHPNRAEAYTCWTTLTGARKTNYGTRIDYIFADVDLLPHLESASILSHVEGSDHCPISVTVNCEIVHSEKCPSFCTKYWPEFTGKQQRLTSFLLSNRHRSKTEAEELNPVIKRTRQNPQQKTIKNFFKSERNVVRKIKEKNDSKCKMENAILEEVENTREQTEVKTDVTEDKKNEEAENVIVGNASQQTEDKTSFENVIPGEVGTSNRKEKIQAMWKTLLKGPPTPPKCTGHQETCLVRTVKKEGPNYGRQFFVCCRPEGRPDNPEARCDSFQWITRPKLKEKNSFLFEKVDLAK